MEGSFEQNKPGYYEVKNVAEIEGFDKDQYGNTWYNVLFQGDAETFMWLKKDPPIEGQKYYGHLELTKSGKRLRFRTDKTPEQTTSSSSAGKDTGFLKDVSNTPIMIYNGSLNYAKEAGLNLISDENDRRLYLEYVKDITNEILNWIDKIRGSGGSSPRVEVVAHPPTSQTQVARKPEPATTLADRWKQASNKPSEEYGDEDIPSEFN